MFYLISIPRPSLTKTCALRVFRVVRDAMDGIAAAGDAANTARKEIAEAWVESGRDRK